jgi:hypothetical protein
MTFAVALTLHTPVSGGVTRQYCVGVAARASGSANAGTMGTASRRTLNRQ